MNEAWVESFFLDIDVFAHDLLFFAYADTIPVSISKHVHGEKQTKWVEPFDGYVLHIVQTDISRFLLLCP